MATGYTYEVAEKDDFTFEDFVWSCARAFGALQHMRDDGHGATISMPEESNYYSESIRRHTDELKRLQALTLAEAKAEQLENHLNQIESVRKGREERDKKRKRYESMILKVESWKEPTKDHEGLKKFMLEQLFESLKHDCDGSYWQAMPPDEPTITPQEWLGDAIKREKEGIKYAQEHAKKEKEGNQKQFDWINKLRNSVPIPQNKLKK